MKLGILSLLASVGLASGTAFGSSGLLEDHYRCTAQGNIQFSLNLINHPDIELANFNSKKTPNSTVNGLIESALRIDGKLTKGDLKTVKVTDGKSTAIIQQPTKGLFCYVGAFTTGIDLQLTVSTEGKTATVDFVCNNTSFVPTGAVECSKSKTR